METWSPGKALCVWHRTRVCVCVWRSRAMSPSGFYFWPANSVSHHGGCFCSAVASLPWCVCSLCAQELWGEPLWGAEGSGLSTVTSETGGLLKWCNDWATAGQPAIVFQVLYATLGKDICQIYHQRNEGKSCLKWKKTPSRQQTKE